MNESAEPRAPEPANVFPPVVRDALVRAAQTPITRGRLWRDLAISHAIAHAMATYPELFRPELT